MDIQNTNELLINNKTETKKESDANLDAEENVIPPQYQNLPSEAVEELWRDPAYIDEEKNQSEIERRQKAIDQIKASEISREEEKREQLTEQYSKLPDEDREKFTEAQNRAMKIAHESIKGEQDLGKLSIEEEFVLTKAQKAYEYFKKEHPDQEFPLEFSSDIDKQVWDNLNYRLAFDVLNSQKEIEDKQEANKIREELNIPTQEIDTEKLLVPEIETNNQEISKNLFNKLRDIYNNKIKNASDKKEKTQREAAWKYYSNAFSDFSNIDNAYLASIVAKAKYSELRSEKYPPNDKYKEAWEYAAQNNNLKHKEENGWVYRGIFKNSEQKTESRGSLNIIITPEVIQKLDNLIDGGIIKGNYKFGEPDTGTDASDRHDAISIYFLEEPSEEALKEISKIGQAYFRGNKLLGKKISEGFYVSEIGSISDLHAKKMLNDLQKIDFKLSKALAPWLTKKNETTKTERVAMSEAQYYAIKDTLDVYGLNIEYDKKNGILIEQKK